MPAATPHLAVADVARHVDEHVFRAKHDREVGLELEWLTTLGAHRRRPTLEEAHALADAGRDLLPGGGSITVEPGGQLELATRNHPDASRACDAAAADLFVFESICRRHGVELTALGADPLRRPARIVTEPRYRAMQHFFDDGGPSGQRMMCNSAALQLNLGYGHDEKDLVRRWRLANQLGPVLIASFANSPCSEGGPSGWQSSRLRWWWRIDPSRTCPVPPGDDPRASWLAYALDARVMLIRVSDDVYVPVDSDLTFGRWLEHGHELGWPTLEDWAYHLTTLFPPVRPRGWFELRMIDALPTPFWQVAVATVCTLLDDPDLDRRVTRAVEGTTDLWIDAAQLGLGHPALAQAAHDVFGLAVEQLARTAPGSALAALVATYLDRWVARGRCPADDALDRWRATGELFPPPESPIARSDVEGARA